MASTVTVVPVPEEGSTSVQIDITPEGGGISFWMENGAGRLILPTTEAVTALRDALSEWIDSQ